MENRRRFIQGSVVAAAAARSVLGANDRVRVGLIGCGTRGNMVQRLFAVHPDIEYVALCDVARSRMDQTAQRIGGNLDKYVDYREMLDRNDIDAVHIATPDHWHGPITVDACEAGKDVFVEKPACNTIEAGLKMVEAAHEYKRVVAVGIQQRFGEQFQECAKMVQDGLLGKVSHVVLAYPGGYSGPQAEPSDPPDDLDWEMFQGPAPRHPYNEMRQRRWRAFYDYGGGLVTDWGVHIADIAHWYMNEDRGAPRLTSAAAQYVNMEPDPEQVPDSFIITWQYDDFVMSFINAVMPNPELGLNGTHFYGERGFLSITRQGYLIRPGGRRGGPGRGAEGPPPIEAKTAPVEYNYTDDPTVVELGRNWLDCIKSRATTVTDIEIGFHSTLPCLLGLLAIQQGRTFSWDGRQAWPV